MKEMTSSVKERSHGNNIKKRKLIRASQKFLAT